MNKLRDMIAGRLSLREVFWFWSYLMPGLVMLAVFLGGFSMGQFFDDAQLYGIETLTYLIFAPAFIGVWRSAGAYRGLAVWKWLARLWVLVWCYAMIPSVADLLHIR